MIFHKEKNKIMNTGRYIPAVYNKYYYIASEVWPISLSKKCVHDQCRTCVAYKYMCDGVGAGGNEGRWGKKTKERKVLNTIKPPSLDNNVKTRVLLPLTAKPCMQRINLYIYVCRTYLHVRTRYCRY